MIRKDMRFSEEVFRGMVGKQFDQYKCDPFDYTDTVTQIVAVCVDGSYYAMKNIQQPVDYFGTEEDIAVCTFEPIEENEIHSAFEDTQQIITPVGEMIRSISLINENQRISKAGEAIYDIWLTRAVIFHFDEHEILFEKENVPFSEEIRILKGYGLIDKISSSDAFVDGWDADVQAECRREVVTIKD